MTRSIYRQLTGKRRHFHLFTQLFQGPDHLLLVRSNRFEERYQRFYYKDIQALVVTGLPARIWLQASLGVLAATIILLALSLVPIPGWRTLLVLIGLIPAVIALVDHMGGERCAMMLKTAVSNEPLPPVSRMSSARLVISRLKPAIEQVQLGEWTAVMPIVTGPPVMAPARSTASPANRLVLGVFTLVSLNAIIYAVARVTGRNEVLLLLAYSVPTEIVLSIAAMRRRGSDPRWILYSLTGVVTTCAILDIVGGLSLFGFFALSLVQAGRVAQTVKFPVDSLYPQVFFWWASGWRAAVAVAGWLSYFFKIEAAPEAPAEGGATSTL